MSKIVLQLSNLKNKNILPIRQSFLCRARGNVHDMVFTIILNKKEKQRRLLNKQQSVTKSLNSAEKVLSISLNLLTTTG